MKTINRTGMMPDEKAALYGIQTLSDAELLALILRSGTKGTDVVSIAEEVLRSVGGNIGGITAVTEDRLHSLKGIGRVKSSQIAAIAELSRRIWNSRRDLRIH